MQIQHKDNLTVQFYTVDRGSTVVVFVVACRKEGDEYIAVSEPKIFKIIPKKQAVLKGSKKVQVQALPGRVARTADIHVETKDIVSPYFTPTIFQTGFITTIGALPPTRKN